MNEYLTLQSITPQSGMAIPAPSGVPSFGRRPDTVDLIVIVMLVVIISAFCLFLIWYGVRWFTRPKTR
jgi:hypothetical protein